MFNCFQHYALIDSGTLASRSPQESLYAIVLHLSGPTVWFNSQILLLQQLAVSSSGNEGFITVRDSRAMYLHSIPVKWLWKPENTIFHCTVLKNLFCNDLAFEVYLKLSKIHKLPLKKLASPSRWNPVLQGELWFQPLLPAGLFQYPEQRGLVAPFIPEPWLTLRNTSLYARSAKGISHNNKHLYNEVLQDKESNYLR